MKTVVVNRRTEFHPQNLLKQNPDQAAAIEWNLVLDPQHPSRSASLTSANWLTDIQKDRNHRPPAITVFSYRQYWAYVPPGEWNPWRAKEVGPQWSPHTFPTADMSAKPDKLLEPLSYFYGFLEGSGYSLESLYPDLMPYTGYFCHDKPSKYLNPNQYRPWTYYLDQGNIDWLHKLTDYLVNFAGWADGEIQGDKALMLGYTKGYNVWPLEAKKSRIYEDPSRPIGHSAIPMTWWMKNQKWKPTPDMGSGGHHIPAYPATTFVEWWYAMCQIHQLIRRKLDRAGLNHWKVFADWEQSSALSGYFYMERYFASEDDTINYIWDNAMAAAASCDSIIWPAAHDDWFMRRRPWVLELKKQLEKHTTLVEEKTF